MIAKTVDDRELLDNLLNVPPDQDPSKLPGMKEILFEQKNPLGWYMLCAHVLELVDHPVLRISLRLEGVVNGLRRQGNKERALEQLELVYRNIDLLSKNHPLWTRLFTLSRFHMRVIQEGLTNYAKAMEAEEEVKSVLDQDNPDWYMAEYGAVIQRCNLLLTSSESPRDELIAAMSRLADICYKVMKDNPNPRWKANAANRLLLYAGYMAAYGVLNWVEVGGATRIEVLQLIEELPEKTKSQFPDLPALRTIVLLCKGMAPEVQGPPETENGNEWLFWALAQWTRADNTEACTSLEILEGHPEWGFIPHRLACQIYRKLTVT